MSGAYRRWPRPAKAALTGVLAAACLLGGVGAAEAAAATGDLTQKPATAGCVWQAVVAGCAFGTALDGAASVAVSPDGTSAYVASATSAAVAVFDRAADGTLTQKSGLAGCVSNTGAGPCAVGTALVGAQSVTVSPDGRSAYVASSISDALAVFDRDVDGELTQKSGLAGCVSATGGACAQGKALDGAVSVAVSQDGRSAYVAAFTASQVAVFDRAADGTLTQKSGLAGCVSQTGFGPCTDGTALNGATSVAVSPDGKSAYVASNTSDAVAVFDRAVDGELTQKSGLAGCISQTSGECANGKALDGAFSVAVSPDGSNVYVASLDSNAVAVFDREPLPPPLPTPAPAPPAPSPAPADTTRPLLSDLSLSPSRLRTAARGASIAARIGGRVTYRLSEPAAVRFRVERALAGRRVGGRCVRPTRSNSRARRCTRSRTLRGGFTHKGVTGANKFRFTGRLRGRRLRPGRYRLRAIATDPAGNRSRPQRARFRILR